VLSAIRQMPERESPRERRQALRAAVRQLERAEIYLAAVSYMELDDPRVRRTVNRLRSEIDGLRRDLGNERAESPA